MLNSVLHDGQAKTGTAGLLGMALINAIEPFEYLVLMLGSNTDAGVADADLDSVLLIGNRNLYMSTLMIVLDGIIAEIIDHFIQ